MQTRGLVWNRAREGVKTRDGLGALGARRLVVRGVEADNFIVTDKIVLFQQLQFQFFNDLYSFV